MSIKNACSFMSTVVGTCTLIGKLTGHALDILVSPTGIFTLILTILSEMSLSMGPPDSMNGLGLSKIFNFTLLHTT